MLYATARDITASRRASAELEEAKAAAEAASRAKSAFLAAMSHEIRTPMNGVIGMVEVLARSGLSRDQSDMARTIRESAGTLLGIINDILDFSKIEAGQLELERTAVCLTDLVEGICNSLVPIAARRQVHLTTFVSPSIPAAVWSDDTRLRQILYNLVGNAIKFSGGRADRPGRVSIQADITQAAPLHIAFNVIDNGIGMTPATLDKLFVPFSQGEVSTTRRFGGSGLGLAICKRLAELMHGRIAARSKPECGSTFTVVLPFEAAAQAGATCSFDLAGVRCVIVESGAFHGAHLQAYLTHAGAQTRLAGSLPLALRAAARMTAPVVLVRDDTAHAEPAARDLAAPTPAPHHVVIQPGRHGGIRMDVGDTVTVGADGLRKTTFLRAVAVAAGRASPDQPSDEAGWPGVPEAIVPMPMAEARAQGRLVLVAEDDEINQKVILRQLGLLGYAAEVAGNGDEALQLWRSNAYVMLLTDLHMPRMDGYELVESIRREECAAARLPIVALTANALQGEANRAKSAGMDDYLTKPLQLHLLKAVLEKWVAVRPDAAPPPPVSGATGRAVDPAVLASLVGNDADVVCELLAAYLAALQRAMAELRAHVAQGECRHVVAVAHRLKSSSRTVGALVLGDLYAELENAGRAEDGAALAHGMAQLDAAVPLVLADIDTLLAARQLDQSTYEGLRS